MAGYNRKKSNFIFQGGILGIAGILTRIIGMVYRIPVTNIIGPEGNGYYAAAYQVYTIMLLISSYSIPLAVSKLVSARISKGEYINAHKTFKGALIFACVTGGIACILVFFGADFFAGRLMSEPMSAIALRIFAPTLLVVAVMGVLRGYFQGMGSMVPTAISQIIEQIINAVISILAATWLFDYGTRVGAVLREDSWAPAYGAAGSTLGTSLGAAGGLIFLVIILILLSGELHQSRKEDVSGKRESYRFLLRIIVLTIIPVILSTAIYNISELLSNSMFNKIMIIKGLTEKKSYLWGVYSGEYKILLNVPIALSSAMCASVVPTLSSCMASGDRKGARRKVGLSMRFTMLIAFPCAVGLFVLAYPIMSMLFKDGYDLAANLMRLGAINIIFFSISTLSNGILQGINKLHIPVCHAIISLCVHLTTLYFLLSKTNLGIYSVVICNFIFAFLMSVLNHYAIWKEIHYRQEYARTFGGPAIASAIMGIAAFVIYKIMMQLCRSNIISTVISILVSGTVYCVCLIRFGGIREDEMKQLPMGKKLVRIAKKMGLY